MTNSIATACWVPNMSASGDFLRHIQRHAPTGNFFILTAQQPVYGYGLQIIPVEPFGPFENKAYARFNRPSDRYALYAFLRSAAALHQRGYTWMHWVETDCRFKGTGWDTRITDVLATCPGAVVGGTPVAWHAWSRGSAWSMRVIDFAYHYQRRLNIPMALEGAFDGPCGFNFYPNGALGLYLISDLLELFAETYAIDARNNAAEMEAHTTKILAFDYYLGQQLVAKYGISILDRFAVTPAAYSGCGDEHVTEDERKQMLQTGSVVAIHQIKTGFYV